MGCRRERAEGGKGGKGRRKREREKFVLKSCFGFADSSFACLNVCISTYKKYPSWHCMTSRSDTLRSLLRRLFDSSWVRRISAVACSLSAVFLEGGCAFGVIWSECLSEVGCQRFSIRGCAALETAVLPICRPPTPWVERHRVSYNSTVHLIFGVIQISLVWSVPSNTLSSVEERQV